MLHNIRARLSYNRARYEGATSELYSKAPGRASPVRRISLVRLSAVKARWLCIATEMVPERPAIANLAGIVAQCAGPTSPIDVNCSAPDDLRRRPSLVRCGQNSTPQE